MKVCVVTASRSEYGVLRWTLDEIRKSTVLELQLVVTGGHLSPSQGTTVSFIEDDGFSIDAAIDMQLASDSPVAVAKSMGICSMGVPDVFARLKPDLLLVLGDRYELLPVCSAALVMSIPIAHISGGDVTKGAVDDQVRHAVSKMATLHFPATSGSAERLRRMGERPDRIFTVGEPGLDNFHRLEAWPRERLSETLGLDVARDWVLLTWHPETTITSLKNLEAIQEISEALSEFTNIQILATYANADVGGDQINKFLESWSARCPQEVKVVKSLGQVRYLSMMGQVVLVVGNSSSGLIEAPFVPVRSLDIGHRQDGRYRAKSVTQCEAQREEVRAAIIKCIANDQSQQVLERDVWYGDGFTAPRIRSVLESFSEGLPKKFGFAD